MKIQEAIEYMRMYKGENVNGESHLGHAFDLSDEIIDMAIEALQRGLENVNADSCSEKPNRSEPKTAESGSVDSEQPEIKTDRTIGGMIYRQDAINAVNVYQKRFEEIIGTPDDSEVNAYARGLLLGVERSIKALPPAQPERKKGEWIENSPVTEKCDQCGYVIRDWFVSQFNFCPNCGCQMGGIIMTNDRDCDTCAYQTRYGCSSWDCNYINRHEAIEAYKRQKAMEDDRK